jgi:hypothetical protein
MRTSVDLRFEKGDPVREYWLAHGEGFAVETRRGRVVGEVVDIVVDPVDQHVVSLVVRRALGFSELPAEQIQAVVPGRDAFVLDGAPPQEEKPRRRERRTRLRYRLSGARRRLAALARRLAAWLGPRLRLAGRAIHAAAILALAWVVWVARWTAYSLRMLAARGRSRLGELLERRQ